MVRRRQAAAFTLMEMLVVMAVIGILMGLLFPALMGARERAKLTRARSEIQTVQEAWLAYWATYTNFPAKSIEMNPQNVAILAGTDTAANPYGIAFMEFDQRHLDYGFFDPWGKNFYQVVFDVGESTNVWHFATRTHLINTARNRY